MRSLAQAMEEKDPWVLFSRPVEWSAGFVDQRFWNACRSRHRTRKTYLHAAGHSGAQRAGVPAVWRRHQRGSRSGCIGAVYGCAAVLYFGGGGGGAALCSAQPQQQGRWCPAGPLQEELGGIDAVQLDADDPFGPDSVNLEDIRIFKGGRMDRDILYTASVLNQSCNTLRGLFRQIS